MTEPTVTITIRVPKSLKEKLEGLSQKNLLNLNLLINQILTKNVHWDEHLTKLGWLQFDPVTVKEIFQYLEEDEIINISKSIKNDIINGIKFIFGDSSFEHTTEFIDSWLTVTNTSFRHIENKGTHKFLVTHDLGEKWSFFATRVTEEFIKKLNFQISDINLEQNSYSFILSK